MRNFGRLSYGSDHGRQTGGTCTDHTGLLGAPGAKVPCADLRAAQEGKPQGYYTPYEPIDDDSLLSRLGLYLDETFEITDEPAAPKEDRTIAYVAVLAILGLGAYNLYQRRSS